MTLDLDSREERPSVEGRTADDECVGRVTRLAARLLGVPTAIVTLVESESRLLRDCDRLPDFCTDDPEPPSDQWFHQDVVAAGRTLSINDVRGTTLAAAGGATSVALIGAPINATATGRTIGALCAADARPRAWTADDERLLADLAAFVAAEIEVRREAELRRTTDVRLLADAMPQIVWTARPDGRLDYYNQRWFDYTGMTFEQTKDWGWKPVVHPDDLDGCIARWTHAFTTGSTHEEEIRIRRASDGAYRWHLSRALPMRGPDGKVVQWVGTSTDIHDRKVLADELEAAHADLEARVAERTIQVNDEKRFVNAVLSHIADGIVACDPAGRITYMNGAAREMQGITDAHTGRPATDLSLYEHATGQPLPWERRPLAIALRNQPMDTVEFYVHRPGGEVRDIVASARPMIDSAGDVAGAVSVWHDVTELRRSQRDLVKAKEAAEGASRSKGEFLANMSHEIRTPMTAIIGYAGLLSDGEPSAEERADYVQVIQRNGDHLLCIVNDILDLSKIEAGKMRVERMAMSPRRVVAEVESSMRVRAVERRIAFAVECAGDVPETIWSDPTRFRQVLLNLVSNAIKFTASGGVRVVLSAGAAARTLSVAVIDTGIGITQEQVGRLFEPFAQADTSTTRRFGGTGLGLAVSKRLVEMLGGSLTVESVAGRGSTFGFTIACPEMPAGAGAPAAERLARVTSAMTRLAGRVLLAEDSVDNRRLVRLYLEEAGLTVDVAVDGRAAVDAVVAADGRGEPFDLVLMDMQMPVMDGYAATRHIRGLGYADLPIVAFTAHAMAAESDRCAAAGCDDYATKPVDPVSLVETIARNLHREQRPRLTVTATDSGDPAGDVLRSELRDVRPINAILPEYVAGLPAHVAAMAASLASRDLERLISLAHQLRGSAGSYGFSGITELAATAEASLRSDGVDGGSAAVDALIRLVRRVEGYDRSREWNAEPMRRAA